MSRKSVRSWPRTPSLAASRSATGVSAVLWARYRSQPRHGRRPPRRRPRPRRLRRRRPRPPRPAGRAGRRRPRPGQRVVGRRLHPGRPGRLLRPARRRCGSSSAGGPTSTPWPATPCGCSPSTPPPPPAASSPSASSSRRAPTPTPSSRRAAPPLMAARLHDDDGDRRAPPRPRRPRPPSPTTRTADDRPASAVRPTTSQREPLQHLVAGAGGRQVALHQADVVHRPPPDTGLTGQRPEVDPGALGHPGQGEVAGERPVLGRLAEAGGGVRPPGRPARRGRPPARAAPGARTGRRPARAPPPPRPAAPRPPPAAPRPPAPTSSTAPRKRRVTCHCSRPVQRSPATSGRGSAGDRVEHLVRAATRPRTAAAPASSPGRAAAGGAGRRGRWRRTGARAGGRRGGAAPAPRPRRRGRRP